MNQTPDTRRSILYIDDEEKALKYFRMAFSPKFSIFTASSGEEGLALLRREGDKIGVVVSDQRMPGMIGADVLGTVRQEFPRMVRILTTAYSDLQSAILAVNKGYIYQYVVKPWEVAELEMVLHRALDYHHILSERNELLRLKMSTLQRIICCDRVKWLLLAFGTGEGKVAGAFRRALFSLVRSQMEAAVPCQIPENVFRAAQFDAVSLIQGELQAGNRIKEVLAGDMGGGTGFEQSEAVLRLGEQGAELASVLGAWLSALPEGGATRVEVDGGVKVVVSPTGAGFVEALSGVLFARDPQAASLLLLRTLWKFAEAGVLFGLDVEQPEAFRIVSQQDDVSAGDVADALRGVFERWDVASL